MAEALNLSTAPESLPINVDGKHVGDLLPWQALTSDKQMLVSRYGRKMIELAKKGRTPSTSLRHKVLRAIVDTDDIEAIFAYPEALQNAIISRLTQAIGSDWDGDQEDAIEKMFEKGWDDEDDDEDDDEGEAQPPKAE